MLTFILTALISLSDIITFNKTDIDLGYIDMAQEKYSCLFKLTNNSEDSIEISEVKTSCDCTTATWTNGSIPPGKMGIIRIEYHPETCYDGYFEREIYVHINGSEEYETVKIHGTYYKPDKVSPEE